MSRRKKKSPLRNEFTDALNVEIAERKIIERTQPQEEIFQKTVTLEKSVEVEKVPVAQVEPVIEVKEIVPPPVEVKVDEKLEERIFKEADNDFFDEKPAEIPTEKPQKKSIYRSKGMQRWEAEREEKKSPPPNPEPPKIEQPRKMSHAEKVGVVVSVVMLIYAFVNFDKPLFFLALSLFVHFLGSPVSGLFGKHSAAVQNALHTFSIVLFCGAVLFLFM